MVMAKISMIRRRKLRRAAVVVAKSRGANGRQDRPWLSLCAEAPAESDLARHQRILHARVQSSLLSGLRDLRPGEKADRTAYAISALIAGLWVRLGLDDPTISSALAPEPARHLLGGVRQPGIDGDAAPG